MSLGRYQYPRPSILPMQPPANRVEGKAHEKRNQTETEHSEEYTDLQVNVVEATHTSKGERKSHKEIYCILFLNSHLCWKLLVDTNVTVKL